jgi:hypothetical protein
MERVILMTRTQLTSEKTKSKNEHPDPFYTHHVFNQMLSPLVEPATDATEAQIDKLLEGLGCLSDRPSTNTKLRVLLSSFLLQAQRLQDRVDRKGGSLLIGWPHDESYWRIRSKVGYTVAKQLREAMIDQGWITHKIKAERDVYNRTGNTHGYLISDEVPAKANGLDFQSNDSLIYATKVKGSSRKTVDSAIDKRTKALWSIWKAAPLTHGNLKMWTATRSFSDKALTKGGRFYGPWTSMKKELQRLHCTIDDQQVVEVDVRGMHLTLMFAISGKSPFGNKFSDPYQLPSLDGITRKEIKAVINSAIGGGTIQQTQPTKMHKIAGINQDRLTEIRGAIIPAYECLDVLWKKGAPREFYSENLAWHEAEIMMRVIETLQQPIFILHDCLICQKDTAKDVGLALQNTFISYCQENGWTPIKPAFTIEYLAGETVKEEVVDGYFNP